MVKSWQKFGTLISRKGLFSAIELVGRALRQKDLVGWKTHQEACISLQLKVQTYWDCLNLRLRNLFIISTANITVNIGVSTIKQAGSRTLILLDKLPMFRKFLVVNLQ